MNVLYCKRHKQLAQVAWACPESDGFCNAVPMRLIPDNAETVVTVEKAIMDNHHKSIHNLAIAVLDALDGETP